MLNTINIMGRLCADPVLRRTQSGKPVTSFTIACERDFKNGGGEKQVDYCDCVCWNNTAEFVSRYFTKGRMAVVVGRLQMRDWTDKEGNKRRNAEIVADNVYFGDSKNGSKSDPLDNLKSFDVYEENDAEDDDELPF